MIERGHGVVEIDFVDLMIARQPHDRAHFDARLGHVDQQEADRALRLGGRVGLGEAEDVRGVMGVGGPQLAAVDDIVAILTFRARLEAGEVGAGAGLGKALAPEIGAIQDAGQEIGFLLVSAEMADDRAEQLEAQDRQAGRVGQRTFLFEDIALDRRPAGAAAVGRPIIGEPALGAQDRLPLAANVRLHEHARRRAHAFAQMLGQIIVEEAADFGAERLILGGEIKVHLIVPKWSRRKCRARRRHGNRPYADRRALAARHPIRAVAAHFHRPGAGPTRRSARHRPGTRHRC